MHDKKLMHDVIDGKQRLETIIKYLDPTCRVLPERIEGTLNTNAKRTTVLPYKKLTDQQQQEFLTYSLCVTFVEGEYSDILNLFIRINSLGEPLRKMEIRNARYINSTWIKAINRIIKAKKYKPLTKYVRQVKNMSGKVNRMLLEEFLLELMVSIKTGEIQDGKGMLDQIIRNDSEVVSRKEEQILDKAMDWLIDNMPNIRSTRLSNRSDFYTLFKVISDFVAKGYILDDKKANTLAKEVLLGFYAKVDQLIDNPKLKVDESVASYHASITKATDRKQNRVDREKAIMSLLSNVIILRRDSKRLFSETQRRILWNGVRSDPLCPQCRSKLTWDDITIDHIMPWSKGGKTELRNGQVLCRSCNSKKGDKQDS